MSQYTLQDDRPETNFAADLIGTTNSLYHSPTYDASKLPKFNIIDGLVNFFKRNTPKQPDIEHSYWVPLKHQWLTESEFKIWSERVLNKMDEFTQMYLAVDSKTDNPVIREKLYKEIDTLIKKFDYADL